MTFATTWWAAPTCSAQSFTVHEPHHGIAASGLASSAATRRSDSEPMTWAKSMLTGSR